MTSVVLSQLLVSALAARQADFSEQDLKSEVLRLRELFANLDTERPTAAEMTFADLAETLAGRWDGFVELEIVQHPSLISVVCDKSWALVEVLNEAISNAIRHGMASTISIDIEPVDNSIYITVSDNGLGPTSGKPGLGTKIINEITEGNWSIKTGPNGGAVLKLQLTNLVS